MLGQPVDDIDGCTGAFMPVEAAFWAGNVDFGGRGYLLRDGTMWCGMDVNNEH